MNTFLALALIVGVPLAATQGLFYRGAWAGISVIALILALFFGMALPASNIPPPGSTISGRDVGDWFFSALLLVSFASFLAICFYRKPKSKKHETAPP